MKTPLRLLLASALALAAFVAVGVAQATDIEVRPGQSFNDAVRRARPGDRVLVRAGVYQGGDWIGPLNGTAAAPIQILSADGPRRAVIEGGGETLRIGDASSYLVFDGFEVRRGGNNLIHIDGGSHHITLRNIYAHDAGVDGDVMKANQCHHLLVEGCDFARPGPRYIAENPYQECIDFVDVSDSTIRTSFFHDGGSMIAFVKGASRNVTVERNVFSDQRAGASDPMVGLGGATDLNLLRGAQYEAFNVVFKNNVVIGGVQGAIGVYDCSGCYVANNLLLNNDRVLVEFRAGNGPAAASDDVRVVSNIFADTRGRMPVAFLRSSHAVRGLVTSHNLFWNNGVAVPQPSGALVVLAQQPGHLVADPQLVAPPAGADLATVIASVRPRATSPAAGTGYDASVSPFFVLDDFAGTPRALLRDRGPFALPPPGSAPPPVVVVPPPVVTPPPTTPPAAATPTSACTTACTPGQCVITCTVRTGQ